MLSHYLRTRERNGVVAIFHELHPQPVYCSSDQWSRVVAEISDGTEILISDLRQRKLIVDSPEDDKNEFRSVSAALENKIKQPTILYLMTAQGCNFKCTYCPIPEIARRYGESVMSQEDALAGIDLWLEHLKDVYVPSLEYFVIFYGGEPLLNKEVIRQSLEYLHLKKLSRELPEKISFMIATNGSLVDDETVALCKKYDVMVAVGLDGPKASNDTMKVDIYGNGTFDRIVAAIRLLIKGGVRTFASATITPYNINQVADYASFFKELGVEKFGFNFLKGRLLLDVVGTDNLQDYYLQASRSVIEQARRHGNAGFEYQMEKKQTSFDRQDFFPVDCTCYGNQLVIQPDGQISNCPFYKAWLGHVKRVGKDFRIWDQTIIAEWRMRLPLYHSGDAKAMCGGGCAWSSSELKGSPLAVDDSSRIFSEEVLNELIWSKYDRARSQKA